MFDVKQKTKGRYVSIYSFWKGGGELIQMPLRASHGYQRLMQPSPRWRSGFAAVPCTFRMRTYCEPVHVVPTDMKLFVRVASSYDKCVSTVGYLNRVEPSGEELYDARHCFEFC